MTHTYLNKYTKAATKEKSHCNDHCLCSPANITNEQKKMDFMSMDKEFELARLVPQSCSSVGWIGGSFFACFRGLVWISHYLCSMQSAFKLTT